MARRTSTCLWPVHASLSHPYSSAFIMITASHISVAEEHGQLDEVYTASQHRLSTTPACSTVQTCKAGSFRPCARPPIHGGRIAPSKMPIPSYNASPISCPWISWRTCCSQWAAIPPWCALKQALEPQLALPLHGAKRGLCLFRAPQKSQVHKPGQIGGVSHRGSLRTPTSIAMHAAVMLRKCHMGCCLRCRRRCMCARSCMHSYAASAASVVHKRFGAMPANAAALRMQTCPILQSQ